MFDIDLILRWDCCQPATTSRCHSHTRCTPTRPKKDGSSLVHSKKHSQSTFRLNSLVFGMTTFTRSRFQINYYLSNRDTVNSVGLIPRRLPFTTSNTIIRTFRHAVALDERRAKFKANLWNRPDPAEATLGVDGQKPEVKFKAHRPNAKKNSLRAMERQFSGSSDNVPTDIEEVLAFSVFVVPFLTLFTLSGLVCWVSLWSAHSKKSRSENKLMTIFIKIRYRRRFRRQRHPSLTGAHSFALDDTRVLQG